MSLSFNVDSVNPECQLDTLTIDIQNSSIALHCELALQFDGGMTTMNND